MEPLVKEINTVKSLIRQITINGKEISQINIQKLIFRPQVQRIVLVNAELGRVIVYQGEEEFEAHKNDSNDSLISDVLKKIDNDYTKK